MRIHVDAHLCTGHGMCAAMAPAVYELDDVGFCAVDDADVAPGDYDAAQKGVTACPEQAITLEGD
ncbi:ferredoxin [Mycolicibacterium moriokaense]|uniref:Ferredoxin n=1 Tax=Mycolicibacterium moriokaense TaxID=39691 RepID=A0A318HG30_9MYCO|nr:ferredoxin [Mycolicibacterium moriokaense]PXX01678.1 ferredoxin [Mycolicibacterium moriokaense]